MRIDLVYSGSIWQITITRGCTKNMWYVIITASRGYLFRKTPESILGAPGIHPWLPRFSEQTTAFRLQVPTHIWCTLTRWLVLTKNMRRLSTKGSAETDLSNLLPISNHVLLPWKHVREITVWEGNSESLDTTSSCCLPNMLNRLFSQIRMIRHLNRSF